MDALIPHKTSSHLSAKNKGELKTGVIELELNQIRPSSHQPRMKFEQEKLDELTQSIKARGIIQPILVRQDGNGYIIVAGERRYRAMKSLGEKTIPAIIMEASHEQSLIMALIENLQREDLNPVEEGEAYHRLIKEHSYTQEKIAEEVGKSRSAIANAIRLIKLPSEIKRYLIEQKLSMGHVRCLLAVEDPDKQLTLAMEAVENNLSVRELENQVYSKKKKENEDKKSSKFKPEKGELMTDPDMKVYHERLQHKYSCKVHFNGTFIKGSIYFDYNSKEELHRILELFGAY
ncbi:MAG: ParB/RepB/Spo0J family partition protein [Candidatus Aureabacteria bacterium]|nr:ParB/RepB/Spo0J family partition protein [Candidatus Auribacterota bacterium]